MTKRKRTILLSAVATLVVLIGASLLIDTSPEKTHPETNRIKALASQALTYCLESNDSLLCGVVSFKETGSNKEPATVIIARYGNNPASLDDFSYAAERVAIVPGAVMQTATLTWLMDHHGVRPDSSRYCIEKRVMAEDLRKGLFWYFDDFFGSSRATQLPNLRLISDPELLAVANGSGLMLSPDQIVNFYDILAGGGLRPRHRYYPRKQVCKAETAAEMRRLLCQNVTDGAERQLANCPVPIAGKTGSGVMDRGFVPGNGYLAPDRPMSASSFAGFFPAEAPRYTMLISIVKKDDSIPETVTAMNLYQEIVEQMQKEGLL